MLGSLFGDLVISQTQPLSTYVIISAVHHPDYLMQLCYSDCSTCCSKFHSAAPPALLPVFSSAASDTLLLHEKHAGHPVSQTECFGRCISPVVQCAML